MDSNEVTVEVEVDLAMRRPPAVHARTRVWVTAETWQQAEMDAMNLATLAHGAVMAVGCRIVDWRD